MKEHPLLCKAPTVRLLLNGAWQIRIPLKPQPEDWGIAGWHYPLKPKKPYAGAPVGMYPEIDKFQCPYKMGDRIWIKETWADVHPLQVTQGRYSQEGRAGIPGPPPVHYRTIYRADGEYPPIWPMTHFPIDYPYRTLTTDDPIDLKYYPKGTEYGWNSSALMPRWASRLTFEVVGLIKVTPLITWVTYDDMRAEGCRPNREASLYWRETLADNYHAYWDSKPFGYTYDDNPWTWVLSIKRLEHE